MYLQVQYLPEGASCSLLDQDLELLWSTAGEKGATLSIGQSLVVWGSGRDGREMTLPEISHILISKQPKISHIQA